MDQTVLVEQACDRLRKLLMEYPKFHGDFQRWVWKREEEVKTAKILKEQGRDPLRPERSHASSLRAPRLRFKAARSKPAVKQHRRRSQA